MAGLVIVLLFVVFVPVVYVGDSCFGAAYSVTARFLGFGGVVSWGLQVHACLPYSYPLYGLLW